MFLKNKYLEEYVYNMLRFNFKLKGLYLFYYFKVGIV